MPGRTWIAPLAGLAVIIVAVVCFLFFKREPGHAPATKISPPIALPATNSEASNLLADDKPEDPPPPGLPIVPCGRRRNFPVIRQPRYVDAQEGDLLLAREEPVLGLVVGGDARAYSTNQLNEHEMVLDEIAGTPVLVSY